MLVVKYGVEGGGWRTRPIWGSHGCSLWKGIMAGWEAFSTTNQFDMGKGDKVWSWQDKWCGDRLLKEVFPLLFECSRDRDEYINSLYA